MSITTFAKLITTPGSKKIFLAEIEPSEQKTSWTLQSGSIYYTAVKAITITSVVEDGVTLTEVTSLATVTAGKWYHGKDKVYLQASSGTPYSNVIVLNYKMYIATENITLNSTFYEGILANIPNISQQKKEPYWGVSVIADGDISVYNNNGYFDEIYKDYKWNNKTITIYLGGEDLPYSEYAKQFGGIIINTSLKTNILTMQFEDNKNDLEDTIPKNTFTTSIYPNLDSEDIGKAIPLIYGTVYKVPVICTSRGLGTATSNHSFKILDTSVCSVTTISQVYVNDVAKTHASGVVSAATFKLASGTYSPGDSVTVSIIAATDNPVEQLKSIASNVLSIPYNSSNYDTATVSAAVTDASVFPCGLAIYEATSFLEICGDLMKSCMGSLINNNEGKYSISIWDVEVDNTLTDINFTDIIDGTFMAISKLEDIRKTMRVGWRKNWEANNYSYSQLSSDTTERLYGVKKTKTVTTLQSTQAGVNIILGRLSMIFETETMRIQFSSKLQLADKNIGDRIQISFKRKDADNNFEWIDSLPVEINVINKDYKESKLLLEVDDLKGVGVSVGHWTADAPVFPYYLGGGSMATWDKTWSTAQKEYAKANAGFWCNDDNFIDSSDDSSYKISRWW